MIPRLLVCPSWKVTIQSHLSLLKSVQSICEIMAYRTAEYKVDISNILKIRLLNNCAIKKKTIIIEFTQNLWKYNRRFVIKNIDHCSVLLLTILYSRFSISRHSRYCLYLFFFLVYVLWSINNFFYFFPPSPSEYLNGILVARAFNICPLKN